MKKNISLLGQLIFLNLLFIVSSSLIVTIGAGISSCYETIKMLDKEIDINIISFYLKELKKVFKKVFFVNFLSIIAIIVFLFIFRFLWEQEIFFAKIILFPFISSTLIIFLMLSYYYYYVNEKKEYNNLDLLKYSLYKSLVNIKQSFLILAYPLLILILFLFYSIIVWEFIIVVGFSVNFYINFKILKNI